MNHTDTQTPARSLEFEQLYCDPGIYDGYSSLHPVSFRRVLPFQSSDEGVDDRNLLAAETAHLAQPNDTTRRAVVEEYFRCGLLDEMDAANLRSTIDSFAADFFEMMGLVYANAGKFRCALRWYRELIGQLENQNPALRSDEESVYASVGYCLYSLGLFEEAIAWSKSCIGPGQPASAVCRALIDYEILSAGGGIQRVERSGSRTRYTINAPAPQDVNETVARLKNAMQMFVPFQQCYIDWLNGQLPDTEVQSDGYPFRIELDAGSRVRHKMNLIFASGSHADALVQRGYFQEAKRVLTEVMMIEPNAGFIRQRLEAIDQRAR